MPTWELEQQYWAEGIELIAGVDEVGMGAWAGPVVAGVVIFKPLPPSPYQGRSKDVAVSDGATLIEKFPYLPYRRLLTEVARENRKKQTLAEKKLWKEVLREKQLAQYKFIRQKPLLNFIADFYCPELCLVIEVDGDSHNRKQEYDQLRTEALEQYGVRVIRYTNDQVLKDIPGVYLSLVKEIQRIEQHKWGQAAGANAPPDKGELEGVSRIVIRDSKTMSGLQREKAALWIKEHALAWGIGEATVEEITALNIRGASQLAMRRAVEALRERPHLLFVDGTSSPNTVDKLVDNSPWHYPTPAVHVVKGDAKSFSIAGASILAKVYRDHVMHELDARFPAYGFAQHKGYGSAAHLAALREAGISPVHRPTYAPVRALI